MTITGFILYVALCLLLAAFFSGMEAAFMASHLWQRDTKRRKEQLPERILNYFSKKPFKFVSTMLAGNVLALVVYGMLMFTGLYPRLSQLVEPSGYSMAGVMLLLIGISSLLSVFFAEYIPKNLFLRAPDLMFRIFAAPMYVIYSLFYPLTLLLVRSAHFFITWVLKARYSESETAFAISGFNNYQGLPADAHAAEEEAEAERNAQIFNNAVELKTVRVRECMVPRTEIVAIDKEEGIEELKKAYIEHGYSKVLVYEDSIDNIVGYCHSSALFKKPKRLEDIINPIHVVPETMLANDLLIRFIKERKSIALVVDEFGGTSGIVCTEDVMEEIVGEIEDEHDEEEQDEVQLDERNYLVSARLEVDYLNEKYNWQIPEGDYDTLAGYLLSVHGDIPEVGQIIDTPSYTFTIISTAATRLDTVKVTISAEE